MRRGRAVVMAGAVAALALMTGISVALGRLFTRLPDSLSSSLPLGEYCAAALLLFFGVKALKVRHRSLHYASARPTALRATPLFPSGCACDEARDDGRRRDGRA
jgi:putative Ca2+/H+ antiporter (TMEM165/GDT1 family)